jgi:hypothetical protein
MLRTYEVPGCAKPHVGRGYCSGHYPNLVKHGSPHAPTTKQEQANDP